MAGDPTEIQAHLRRLPPRHLAALRAALMGLDDEDIARLLDVPVESVPTTLQVAAAKLTTLLADQHALRREERRGGGPESVPPC
jgi:DNA-directed RNA polymerase specialized sigma24 family protein